MEPVILKDEDLQETERFRNGVFCFFKKQFGISFKNAHPGLIWECSSRYLTSNNQAPSYSKKISCLIPILSGTFVPLRIDNEQWRIMASLLDVCALVEELLEAESIDEDDRRCSSLRSVLNDEYNSFVSNYGLIRNCSSYFDGIWNDIRLQIYLLQLESEDGQKADIFFKRMNRPVTTKAGQMFFESDINERIAAAYVWCMAWFGKVVLSEIAEKADIDEDIAANSILAQGLGFRDVSSFATENSKEQEEAPVTEESPPRSKTLDWWDVIGCSSLCCSYTEFREMYHAKARANHSDSGGTTTAMQSINLAYEEGKEIVEKRYGLSLQLIEVLFQNGLEHVQAMCSSNLALNFAKRKDKLYSLTHRRCKKALAFFSTEENALKCLRIVEEQFPEFATSADPSHQRDAEKLSRAISQYID